LTLLPIPAGFSVEMLWFCGFDSAWPNNMMTGFAGVGQGLCRSVATRLQLAAALEFDNRLFIDQTV